MITQCAFPELWRKIWCGLTSGKSGVISLLSAKLTFPVILSCSVPSPSSPSVHPSEGLQHSDVLIGMPCEPVLRFGADMHYTVTHQALLHSGTTSCPRSSCRRWLWPFCVLCVWQRRKKERERIFPPSSSTHSCFCDVCLSGGCWRPLCPCGHSGRRAAKWAAIWNLLAFQEEDVLEVIKDSRVERISERSMEQIVDVPVPQILGAHLGAYAEFPRAIRGDLRWCTEQVRSRVARDLHATVPLHGDIFSLSA